MNVLIVCNNAYISGNGLCTAIRKLHQELKGRGINAKLMASSNPIANGPQPDYKLGHFKVPLLEKNIESNGFRYAKTDRKVITEAVQWADVIHLEEAFGLESATIKIAAKYEKPCVGTFHLFTENVMANLGMRKARLINRIYTRWWRKNVFDKCKIVHCPTEIVKDHLVNCGFKSELRVISNGISDTEKGQGSTPTVNPYKILCTGRLSNEKSQSTLLEAMRYSRHAKEIQLIFAGKGPKEAQYRKMADKLVKEGVLSYQPSFGFYNINELSKIASEAYLYIHCAYIEVEGLSCLEALRCGAVPVIAEGPLIATSQFALDDRSKFRVCDSKDLANKIDWWIDHPKERNEMSEKYALSTRKYDISKSTDAIIKMYEDACK